MEEHKHQATVDGSLLLGDEDDDKDALLSTEPIDGSQLEKADFAADVLQALLDLMDFDAEVEIREDTDDEVILDIDGPDAGRAIGKRGQTLDALQFTVNKIVNRSPDSRQRIVVDSGDYRERYEQGLVSMARRQAKRAIDQGKVIILEPMSARDRRSIHLALAEMQGVSTESEGEGSDRRVQIVPHGLSLGEVDHEETQQA